MIMEKFALEKKKFSRKKKKEQMNAAWGRDHFTILEIPYKVISM